MQATHAHKWFVDYEDLDTDQKRLINGGAFLNGQKIALINGPAGSGKTIILVNALKQNGTSSVAFVSYTRSLLNLAYQGLGNCIPAMTYQQAIRHPAMYDLVVVDETQDIPLGALHKIIAKGQKVILAGDNFQKIYDEGIKVNQLEEITRGNIHRLLKSYRLTPKAFAAASKLFPEALEGVSSSGKHVIPIELYKTDDFANGDEICYRLATTRVGHRRTAAILLPTRDAIVAYANFCLELEGKPLWNVQITHFSKPDFGLLNAHLRQNGIKLQVVQNNFGDLNDAFENSEVVLQTYHSAKGLDYEVVCLPNCSVESAGKEHLQKSLFYVAITRASGALIITQHKDLVSPYVKMIEEFCDDINPDRLSFNNEEDEF